MEIFPKKVTCLRAVALLIVGTSSVAANNHGRAQDVETLDRAELRRLLRNVSLTPVQDPGVRTSNPGTETFYVNGDYVRWGDRAHRWGTFEIGNGRVCVRLSVANGPECYRIQRDREGHFWKVDDNQIRTQVHVSTME